MFFLGNIFGYLQVLQSLCLFLTYSSPSSNAYQRKHVIQSFWRSESAIFFYVIEICRFVMVNLNFIDIPIWDNYYVNIAYQNIMIIFAVFPILKFIFKCLDSIYMPLPIKKSFFWYVMLKFTLIPSNINTLEQYLFISTLHVLLKTCWAFTADAELSTILRLAWIWK